MHDQHEIAQHLRRLKEGEDTLIWTDDIKKILRATPAGLRFTVQPVTPGSFWVKRQWGEQTMAEQAIYEWKRCERTISFPVYIKPRFIHIKTNHGGRIKYHFPDGSEAYTEGRGRSHVIWHNRENRPDRN